MTEHTVLPWKRVFINGDWYIDSPDGKQIAMVEQSKNFEADARFIVTACNNYEKVLADNEQLRKHGDFTNYEGRCQQFLRCRICKGRWEWEIEPSKHEENCPAIRQAEEQAK